MKLKAVSFTENNILQFNEITNFLIVVEKIVIAGITANH
jgi:hypothetical protein